MTASTAVSGESSTARVPLRPATLGTMTFGDTVPAETARSVVELAVARGVRMLDTANVYTDGEAERILAPILPTLPDDVVVASKVGMPHADARGEHPLSARAVRWCVEGSLRRLGVDHLDVLYLHQPDGETSLSETLSAVAGLQADGLVGELGVSNFAAWQIARVEQVCDQVGCTRPVLAQQVYNLLARRIEDEYAGFARESGLATVVYNPLAGGLLVAPLGADGPGGSRFSTSRLATMYRGRYLTEPMVRAVRGLAELAADAGLSRVELALRWVDGQEVTTGVLLGASRPEQLGENLDALARGPLPQDVLDRCDAAVADVRGSMPAYNR